jgi:hypothetical protein
MGFPLIKRTICAGEVGASDGRFLRGRNFVSKTDVSAYGFGSIGLLATILFFQFIQFCLHRFILGLCVNNPLLCPFHVSQTDNLLFSNVYINIPGCLNPRMVRFSTHVDNVLLHLFTKLFLHPFFVNRYLIIMVDVLVWHWSPCW